MTQNHTARALAATVIAGCGKVRPSVPTAARSGTSRDAPQRELAALLDRPGLRRATWGITAQSLRTGERLFEHNPGTLDGTTLNGDLVLRGSGVPATLGEGGTDLASAVRDALIERGIARITGRIIGDDNAVEEPRPGLAWSWDDPGTATGALYALRGAERDGERQAVRGAPRFQARRGRAGA